MVSWQRWSSAHQEKGRNSLTSLFLQLQSPGIAFYWPKLAKSQLGVSGRCSLQEKGSDLRAKTHMTNLPDIYWQPRHFNVGSKTRKPSSPFLFNILLKYLENQMKDNNRKGIYKMVHICWQYDCLHKIFKRILRPIIQINKKIQKG